MVLLTPDSKNRPWIYYESGIGEANPNCEIIPICIGINSLNDIPYPLAMYQCYQLTDYQSIRKFIDKLLGKYEIVFDEELVRPILEKTIQSLAQFKFDNETEKGKVDYKTADEIIGSIQQHFDGSFFQLLDNLGGSTKSELKEESFELYDIPIYVDFEGNEIMNYITIQENDTVQEVLDRIYFLLPEEFVKAFTYLEKWILKDKKSGVRMIIREVAFSIPARYIFDKNFEWVAERLDSPYQPIDSKENLNDWYL